MTMRTTENALAFIAITGSAKYLHVNTRIAITRLERFNVETCRHEVTNEGMILARSTAMWRAHQRMLALGFRLAANYNHKPSFILYRHPEMVCTPDGRPFERSGFIGHKGHAYADLPSTESRHGWRSQLLSK